MVTVAEPGANASVSLLRALKREFGFYCIELNAEPEPEQSGMVFGMGGVDAGFWTTLSIMERYNVSFGQWSPVSPIVTVCDNFGACAIAGELYATGGPAGDYLTSVEK
jgi:hypothetical protein